MTREARREFPELAVFGKTRNSELYARASRMRGRKASTIRPNAKSQNVAGSGISAVGATSGTSVKSGPSTCSAEKVLKKLDSERQVVQGILLTADVSINTSNA